MCKALQSTMGENIQVTTTWNCNSAGQVEKSPQVKLSICPLKLMRTGFKRQPDNSRAVFSCFFCSVFFAVASCWPDSGIGSSAAGRDFAEDAGL